MRKTNAKTRDIDMNELLEIDDPRWIAICDKIQDIHTGSKNPIEFIKKLSELDLERKEMFLIGFVTADFLNKVGAKFK